MDRCYSGAVLRWAAAWSTASLVLACGARTDLLPEEHGGGSGGAPPMEEPPVERCGDVLVTVETKKSCSIDVLDGFDMDLEGFIEVDGERHRVLAMDRWGAGHIVGYCDSTSVHELVEAADLFTYLGRRPAPRVASVGYRSLCRPGELSETFPPEVEYLGLTLPAEYRGRPAALAEDWDVIVWCGYDMDWSYGWVEELRSFVETHGKGLLATMDYAYNNAGRDDYTRTSEITRQAGIGFRPANLDWAPLTIDVTCVPDYP